MSVPMLRAVDSGRIVVENERSVKMFGNLKLCQILCWKGTELVASSETANVIRTSSDSLIFEQASPYRTVGEFRAKSSDARA